MAKFIYGFERFVKSLNLVGQRVGMILIFGMMLITVIDVIGRLFGSPLYGAYELTSYSLAIIIFFSIGYTQINKEHITINFLVEKFPVKIQNILEVILNLIFVTLILITAIQCFDYAERLFIGKNVTQDLNIPVFLLVIMSAIGLLFFFLVYLVDLLKSLVKVVHHE